MVVRSAVKITHHDEQGRVCIQGCSFFCCCCLGSFLLLLLLYVLFPGFQSCNLCFLFYISTQFSILFRIFFYHFFLFAQGNQIFWLSSSCFCLFACFLACFFSESESPSLAPGHMLVYFFFKLFFINIYFFDLILSLSFPWADLWECQRK